MTDMKKLVLATLITVGTLQTHAYEYPYLVFQDAEGTTTAMAIDQLTITISNGKLNVTNSNGTQTFLLSNLNKMFFAQTADFTGISNTETDNETVEAFNMGGLSMGKFQDINKAKTSLKPGLYILKSKSKTTRIVVK